MILENKEKTQLIFEYINKTAIYRKNCGLKMLKLKKNTFITIEPKKKIFSIFKKFLIIKITKTNYSKPIN